MITRAYLEDLAAQVHCQFGEDTARQYLRILAAAPKELFCDISLKQQAQRATVLMRAYYDSGGGRSGDVGVELLDVSPDTGVLLTAVDMRDGSVVIAPLPPAVAVRLALTILAGLQPNRDEEEQVGEVKQSVN